MSSQRSFQDYIARVRYSNQLPAPPGPPKLLDIPGSGLSSKYTSAGYASRLAREQPLDIEADAELGMPIDLIGIPGVFGDDERAIRADLNPPPLHPADKALLKPLASIGNSNVASGSSFLRKTEYTANSAPQMFAPSSSKDLLRLQRDSRRKPPTSIDKDDPKNIVRSVIKGFDIAYARDADKSGNIRGAEISSEEARAWAEPKHPSKQGLQLLDSYPLLPDLDALPEGGAFVVTKFVSNPVAKTDAYDERLDHALLRPLASQQIVADYERRKAEWNEASGDPEPTVQWEYDYFIPQTNEVRSIKRKFNAEDPDHENEELYTEQNANGQRVFKYARVRRYETSSHHGDHRHRWNDTVAIALHDPDQEVGSVPGTKKRLQKGAFIYPVSSRSALRPKRKVGALANLNPEDDERIDQLDVTVAALAQDSDIYNTLQLDRADLDPTIQASNGLVTTEA